MNSIYDGKCWQIVTAAPTGVDHPCWTGRSQAGLLLLPATTPAETKMHSVSGGDLDLAALLIALHHSYGCVLPCLMPTIPTLRLYPTNASARHLEPADDACAPVKRHGPPCRSLGSAAATRAGGGQVVAPAHVQ